MVIRRIREHVTRQDWFAVLVDVGVVVLGVFIGTQVSNWNALRVERKQAHDYRERLIEEVGFNALQFAVQRDYYLTAQNYGRQALSSLTGEAPLGDREFLIAAYQLSQNDTTPAKTYMYDEMTANGMVSLVGSSKLQQAVSDYYLGLSVSNRIVAEVLPYRTMIREVMPYDVQKVIRDACGDRDVRQNGRLVGVRVVVPCLVRLDPAKASAAARVVRATPRLKEEMTRYIASLDEKLDQLVPGVEFSGTIQRELAASRPRASP